MGIALDFCYVLGLKALGTLLDFKFDELTFIQRLISIHVDRGEMHEDIISRLTLDETETLRRIEPLHHTLFSRQCCYSSASDVPILVPATPE